MDFKKYNSIENVHRTKTIQQIFEYGYDKVEWVVSEKCHGSNFAFYMNSEGVRAAKRTSFLGIGQRFFNWEYVMEMYSQHLKLLYDMCDSLVRGTLEDANAGEVTGEIEVILYCELFGGVYNHPDVERDPTAQRVQREVHYAPWNDVYCFDLKVNGRYLHYDLFSELMEATGFHYAKSLYRGGLDECLKYPNDFQTKIPEMLNLPSIEDNIAEGVVIKPVDTLYFPNGERVILKNKNEKFKEKHDKQKNRKDKPKPDLSMNEAETELYEEGLRYINENRLRNVLSHIGPVNDKMFGKVMGLFHKDVLEDWRKDNEDTLNELDKKRVRVIEKRIQQEVAEMIREYFLNIIDGVF